MTLRFLQILPRHSFTSLCPPPTCGNRWGSSCKSISSYCSRSRGVQDKTRTRATRSQMHLLLVMGGGPRPTYTRLLHDPAPSLLFYHQPT